MSRVERNDSCPCGSGKKYKNCCLLLDSRRKPRSEYIYATTRDNVTEISLSFYPMTGAIEFGTPVINTYAQTSYERGTSKGPKVINKVPLSSSALHFISDQSLFDEYEILFAIDTNTRHINGVKHSIGCLVYCEILKPQRAFKWLVPFGIEFINEDKPETFSWKVLIEHIMDDPDLSRISRIGILVDSDLGQIDEYNKRVLPIWGNILVPNNVRLIYASTDTGKEFLVNKLISEADRFAKVLLDHIEEGRVPIDPNATKSPKYRKLFGKPESGQAPYRTLQRSSPTASGSKP